MNDEQERHEAEQERHEAEQERVRLPDYEEPPADRVPAYYRESPEYWQPRGYSGHPRDGHPRDGHPRENGIRASRRASTWTAAALIAGVAATTGYLAHEIPAAGTGSGSTGNTGGTGTPGGTAKPAAKPGTVSPSAPRTPAVKQPVVTSGGSGTAGGAAGGGDD